MAAIAAIPPNSASSPVDNGGMSPEPPSSPHGADLTLEYPYNISHAYLPVPTFRPPAQLEALGVKAPLPDDTDVKKDLPQVQVDYLSPKEWKQESDVWTSWKEMTKHKKSVEDGIRLENASWRTWAQQRNNLKTISPVTLNWLKDSDVTWLYGPLHEAGEEPALPTKESSTPSTQERLGLDTTSTASTSAAAAAASKTDSRPKKSSLRRKSSAASKCGRPGILKHRTLQDVLTTRPESPIVEDETEEHNQLNMSTNSGRKIAFALPENQ